MGHTETIATTPAVIVLMAVIASMLTERVSWVVIQVTLGVCANYVSRLSFFLLELNLNGSFISKHSIEMLLKRFSVHIARC